MRCSFLIALTSSSSAMSRSSAAARAASASIDAGSCEAAGRPSHAATPTAARAPRAIAPCVVRIASLLLRRHVLADGIREAERRHVRVRPRLVVGGRRPIRRQRARDVLRAGRIGLRLPAALVRNVQRLIPVERLDLPDAGILDVLVLVWTFAPESLPAELAFEEDSAPARLRREPVGRERDDG